VQRFFAQAGRERLDPPGWKHYTVRREIKASTSPHPSFMSTKTIIRPAKAAPAVGPYSQGVRIGDLLFCSGQIPLDPAHPSAPVAGDIRQQTEQALANVKALLDDQGLTFRSVVKSTVFLTNLADFAAMNEVYGRHFSGDCPARSTVQVSALPRGAAVEIEVIAHY
jgi:2-iminobutanoate/2-iminopropanoate deaminase